ncbi:MAG: alanyl-tRNA editing protein [Euryarchaeota archaeon]|nr:alanyl-tRNA editing protein [Euryarchaeota archaeon]MDE1880986.1 alanyl-tRNA editing protein [Euryarchaeota archaeon]MDE2046379.1 alanyl-tRNA editing protein [Thermoplasmata archaeon]
MANALYLRDAYLREFEATVTSSRPGEVELSETAFYPAGGGQPCDVGTLHGPEATARRVTRVEKSAGRIVHAVEGETLPVGAKVRGSIDWALRYAHMRYHTCLHILSGVVFHRFGSGITGGQIYPDRARMDLSLPEFSKEVVGEVVAEMNRIVERDLPIEVRFLSREEALRDPSLVRVASELLPDVQEVRLIDIHGFDVQADGGTHLRSTREVGKVSLEKLENKGARNKRLYLTVAPSTPGAAPPIHG